MPVFQRNRNYSIDLVYTTGNYKNPVWISSISPSKVGSGNPNWNASYIFNYPVLSAGLNIGEFLYLSSSGWITKPASGVSSSGGIYFTAQDGITLDGSVLKMSGVGQLTRLNFQQNPNYYIHSGILIKDNIDGFLNLENTFIGTDTQTNSENFYNVAIGRYSMSYSSGNRNIAIGSNALSFNFSEDSIALGTESSTNVSNVSYSNIGIGSYSLSYSNAISNSVGIGESALNSVSNTDRTVAIGYFAGYFASGSFNNVFIGYSAGSYSKGSGNIFIGNNTGYSSSGNNNIEILSGASTSKIENRSDKLNIANFIYGDIAEKKISIGYTSSSSFSPGATLEVIPSGNVGISIIAPPLNTYDFLTCKASSSTLLNIDQSGNISGNNASFNVISGGISPGIVQSTGLLLTDFHHGKIIEHTGIVSGVYTIGTITIPSWQCMLVNYASGLSVASGSNTIRSRNNLTRVSTLYSYVSIYRRPNGEFFLYGELN